MAIDMFLFRGYQYMYILIFTGELAVLQAEIKLKTLTLLNLIWIMPT